MSEWSKEHAWKVCIPHKGIQGSNPCLSANQFIAFRPLAEGNKLILAPPPGISEVNPCLSAFARRSFSEGGLFIYSIFPSLKSGAGYCGRSPLKPAFLH